MKVTRVFVKAALALCCYLGIAFGIEVDCSLYPRGISKDGTPFVACPRNMKPVCGTDGTTYSNECGICLHNQKHEASVEKEHDGECDPKTIKIDCSTYRSTEIDGHVIVACPRILKPVCGSDSFTYDNECGICAYNAEHHTNVSKIHDGECKGVFTIDCNKYPTRVTEDGKVLVSCPRILNPVCGTDGITYDNECGICAHNGEQRTHVTKKHNGKCRQETSEINCSQYPSRMTKGGKALVRCPRILLPVCGTDGFTYDNECGICAHNVEHGTQVKKSHDGRCKEESTPVDCSAYLSNSKTGEALTACPFILREICGTDDVTYVNDCALCAHNIEFGTNVAKKHDGRCVEEVPQPPPVVTASATLPSMGEYHPPGSRDIVRFLHAIRKRKKRGQLNCSRYTTATTKDGKELMVCTMIYDPVCGTDGVTYASECTLCAHNLEHRTTLGKRKNGRCEEDITRELCKDFKEVSPMCTLEYLPHCGSDGKTYSNRCLFCNAYLESDRSLNLMSMAKC